MVDDEESKEEDTEESNKKKKKRVKLTRSMSCEDDTEESNQKGLSDELCTDQVVTPFFQISSLKSKARVPSWFVLVNSSCYFFLSHHVSIVLKYLVLTTGVKALGLA